MRSSARTKQRSWSRRSRKWGPLKTSGVQAGVRSPGRSDGGGRRCTDGAGAEGREADRGSGVVPKFLSVKNVKRRVKEIL